MQATRRRTAASYEADEETVKHVKLLSEIMPRQSKSTTMRHLEQLIENLPRQSKSTTDSVKLQNPSDKRVRYQCVPRQCLVAAWVCRRKSGTIQQAQCKVTSGGESRVEFLQKRILQITAHSAFDVIIMVLILANTVILALYHYGIDPAFERVLDRINLVSSRNDVMLIV